MEKLPTDVAAEVVDLLDHMPEDKPYDTLKNTIIRRMGTSDGKKLHDLFYNLTLGHMTPSQLLRKIKFLLGSNTMSETVLKKLWTDKLHTHTTQILASLPEDLDLERVSEIANRIHENNQNQNVYAKSYNSTNDATPRNTPTPTNTTSQTTTPDMLTELLQGMENLSLQVQNLVKLKASGKLLHRQQVKTTLAAGLKQGSRLFYIRDKKYRIFIFSRHRRTKKRYSTRSQEKTPTIFIHTASGKWTKN